MDEEQEQAGGGNGFTPPAPRDGGAEAKKPQNTAVYGACAYPHPKSVNDPAFNPDYDIDSEALKELGFKEQLWHEHNSGRVSGDTHGSVMMDDGYHVSFSFNDNPIGVTAEQFVRNGNTPEASIRHRIYKISGSNQRLFAPVELTLTKKGWRKGTYIYEIKDMDKWKNGDPSGIGEIFAATRSASKSSERDPLPAPTQLSFDRIPGNAVPSGGFDLFRRKVEKGEIQIHSVRCQGSVSASEQRSHLHPSSPREGGEAEKPADRTGPGTQSASCPQCGEKGEALGLEGSPKEAPGDAHPSGGKAGTEGETTAGGTHQERFKEGSGEGTRGKSSPGMSGTETHDAPSSSSSGSSGAASAAPSQQQQQQQPVQQQQSQEGAQKNQATKDGSPASPEEALAHARSQSSGSDKDSKKQQDNSTVSHEDLAYLHSQISDMKSKQLEELKAENKRLKEQYSSASTPTQKEEKQEEKQPETGNQETREASALKKKVEELEREKKELEEQYSKEKEESKKEIERQVREVAQMHTDEAIRSLQQKGMRVTDKDKEHMLNFYAAKLHAPSGKNRKRNRPSNLVQGTGQAMEVGTVAASFDEAESAKRQRGPMNGGVRMPTAEELRLFSMKNGIPEGMLQPWNFPPGAMAPQQHPAQPVAFQDGVHQVGEVAASQGGNPGMAYPPGVPNTAVPMGGSSGAAQHHGGSMLGDARFRVPMRDPCTGAKRTSKDPYGRTVVMTKEVLASQMSHIPSDKLVGRDEVIKNGGNPDRVDPPLGRAVNYCRTHCPEVFSMIDRAASTADSVTITDGTGRTVMKDAHRGLINDVPFEGGPGDRGDVVVVGGE